MWLRMLLALVPPGWLAMCGSGRLVSDGHMRSGVPAGARCYRDLDELAEYSRLALSLPDKDGAKPSM